MSLDDDYGCRESFEFTIQNGNELHAVDQDSGDLYVGLIKNEDLRGVSEKLASRLIEQTDYNSIYFISEDIDKGTFYFDPNDQFTVHAYLRTKKSIYVRILEEKIKRLEAILEKHKLD